jgi:hypothetical protein
VSATVPIELIETPVVFVVIQLSVDDDPETIDDGVAVKLTITGKG